MHGIASHSAFSALNYPEYKQGSSEPSREELLHWVCTEPWSPTQDYRLSHMTKQVHVWQAEKYHVFQCADLDLLHSLSQWGHTGKQPSCVIQTVWLSKLGYQLDRPHITLCPWVQVFSLQKLCFCHPKKHHPRIGEPHTALILKTVWINTLTERVLQDFRSQTSETLNILKINRNSNMDD